VKKKNSEKRKDAIEAKIGAIQGSRKQKMNPRIKSPM